jgi:hypothetical protein
MPLFLLLLAAIRLGLLSSPGLDAAPATSAGRVAAVQGTVYLARDLSPDNLAVLSAALAGRDPTALLLIDTPTAAPANKAFLSALKPPRIVPVGSFSEDLDPLERNLGLRPESPYHWTLRPPRSFWRDFYPRAESVVVCPASPRALLMQAACLAGTLQAPLYVLHGHDFESDELQALLTRWQTRNVHVIGTAPLPFELPGLQITELLNERQVARAHRRQLAHKGIIHNIVVANPSDLDIAERKALKADKDDPAHVPHSPLAPWVALQRHAALVLTNEKGSDVDDAITEAIRKKELRHADTLILVADLDAIPVQKRPNPVKGDKDEQIEMEPMTPTGREPFSFSVGRLFHEDAGIVPLMLARRSLLERRSGPRRALVASNAGEGGLSLLETISRHTVRELRNNGFETTALFGKEATQEGLRELMPKNDIFIWEGHHNTLIRDWKFPSWDEPLPPSLIFLQSCLALKEWKAEQAFRRGAVGVIGSSTRTYSASGGATSLAFFDALLYDQQSLGGALRQSKNFMLAYTMLKEKRMGDDAKKPGAPLRAAWAFTLWGDPTLKLPHPERPEKATPAVQHRVKGNVILIHLPQEKHEQVKSDKYHTQGYANGRLAGLLGKEKEDAGKALLPMVFAEVHLPKAPAGKTPRLTSKLPSRSWVFNWDPRRRCGYLLAVPREKDKEELRFAVHWEEATSKAVPDSSFRDEPVGAKR